MIQLYRNEDCPFCTEVEEKLKNLVVAYKVIHIVPGMHDLLNEITPPVIVDDGKFIFGSERITIYLENLAAFKDDWDKFQSDSCYCDEYGNVE